MAVVSRATEMAASDPSFERTPARLLPGHARPKRARRVHAPWAHPARGIPLVLHGDLGPRKEFPLSCETLSAARHEVFRLSYATDELEFYMTEWLCQGAYG
jgi:hypothetical protein